MRTRAVGTALLLVAACGGTVATTTTTTASPTAEPTTTQATPVTTATTAQETTATTAVAETTTTVPTAASGPQFVMSTVALGDSAMVVITNIGDEAGSLGGHWLCQRPQYYEFPNVELAAGESAAVSVGGDVFLPPPDAIVIEGTAFIGPFSPSGGEVGFYSSNSFSNPNEILSYVEWGASGHGRSGTAVSAGIWVEGGFVETTADTPSIVANQLPTLGPDNWDTP